MSVRDTVIDVVVSSLPKATRELLEANEPFANLGDSLELVELVMSLETEFNVTIPNEDVAALQTLADVVKYIETKQAKK